MRRGLCSVPRRRVPSDFAIVGLRVYRFAMPTFSPTPIPFGETAAAFPLEPTRTHVRAGCASQGRLQDARIAGHLGGRAIWRARIGTAMKPNFAARDRRVGVGRRQKRL